MLFYCSRIYYRYMLPINRYSIDITPRSFVVVAIGTIGIIALWLVRDFLLLVVLAVIIASFVNAGVRTLKKIHIPRTLGVIIMYLFFIGIAILIALIFIPLLLKEIGALIDILPRATQNTPWAKLLGRVAESGLTEATFNSLVGTSNFFQGIQNFWKTYLTDSVLSGINTVITGIVNTFLVFIMSFFLSIQEGSLNGFLRAITPLQYESYVIDLWNRVEQKIGYWFGGQLIISLLAGIVSFIGFSIIGMPYALLLALLIVILEFIPFGMTLGTFVILPIAFISGGLSLGIPMAIFMLVINFIESNILQPLIVHKTVGIPMLLVIISVIAWIELIGWTGGIIAIPFSVLILELIYDREKFYLERDHKV